MQNPFDFTIIQFQLFALVLLRTTGLVTASPIFGSRLVPGTVKMALVIVLSLLLFSFVPRPDTLLIPDQTMAYFFHGVRELAIGLIIGFSVSIIFMAAQLAGQIMDMQIGFGVANVVNPALGTQGPVIGQFYFIIAILIFLAINGHHYILRALSYSFEVVPITGVRFDIAGLSAVFSEVIFGVFVSAIGITAPVMIVILLSNISVGLLGRSVMRMNLLVVQFPMYIVVGLLIISASLGFFGILMRGIFNDTWDNMGRILRHLSS